MPKHSSGRKDTATDGGNFPPWPGPLPTSASRRRCCGPASPKGAAWAFLVLPEDRQRKTADAEHDDGGRHARWPSLPGHAGTGWPRQPLAEGGQGAAGSRRRRRGRHRRARDHAGGGGTGAQRSRRPAKGARGRAHGARRNGTASRRSRGRDWIHWITSGKKAETRERRIVNACDMLASGKRRACCFDRSGMYSKSMGAPTPADRACRHAELNLRVDAGNASALHHRKRREQRRFQQVPHAIRRRNWPPDFLFSGIAGLGQP